MNTTHWHRSNPATGLRQIDDAAGAPIADCVSYLDGPSLSEAQANAEVIATGVYQPDATPGPWTAVRGQGQWLVRGGTRHVIVALIRTRTDAAELAQAVALQGACMTAAPGPRAETGS